MSALLKPWEEKLGVSIQYSREEEPLGTGAKRDYLKTPKKYEKLLTFLLSSAHTPAGPLALAKKYLVDDENPNAPFFVLNSDVTSEFPFESLLNFHKGHGKEGTAELTIKCSTNTP